jgi:hypothetical protein
MAITDRGGAWGRVARQAVGLAAFGLMITPGPEAVAEVAAPVLKWERGGCTSWCQTGWYASPAVADIDEDGRAEVVWGSYDLVSLDGATGALEWRATDARRVYPGVVVADLTGDGSLEIVAGRNSDNLMVYDSTGAVVWTRHPFGSGEVRTLAVADLEGDGVLEIVAGHAAGVSTNQVVVYDPSGNVRPGWPAKRPGEPGYGAGLFNQNIAVEDLDGDGDMELVVPTDSHYIMAFDDEGGQLPVHAMYTGRTYWSEVGVHVDHEVDLRGYAQCGIEHRPNFIQGAPAIADVDGDGSLEIVVVGNVHNCATSPYTSLYHVPFILRLDRTRWSGGGYDWTVIPSPPAGAGPKSEDYDVIQSAATNVVPIDLDGDGLLEILFPSYDGRMHAYWLDKTQHGAWPYTVPATGTGVDTFRFASEPAVADLDGDGSAEVLFASWPKNGSGHSGHLHVLDALGHELHRVPLPSVGAGEWNGSLAAPTLADIDGDPDLEAVLGTAASGVVAFDLPGTAGARLLWGTGRGGPHRRGVALPGAGPLPTLVVSDAQVTEGDAGRAQIDFTVTLSSPSDEAVSVDFVIGDGTATGTTDPQ